MLDEIEHAIEPAAEAAGVDLEVTRQDNVIEVEFDDGSKSVINSHQAAGEIWLAARAGAWHFRPVAGDPGLWKDTRSGRSLVEMIDEQFSAQAGHPFRLRG